MEKDTVNNKVLAISILDSKDIEGFLSKIKVIQENLNKSYNINNVFDVQIHFDVMDSKFVPNTGINLSSIELVKKFGYYADVHLMVENPIEDKYITDAIEYGADNITIHYEIPNFEHTLNYLNSLKEKYLKLNRTIDIGVSIKPKTDANVLKKYESKFSRVLIMSVEPGYGGQKYITSTDEKIKSIKKLLPNHIIQIDGGVNFDTIQFPIISGTDSFVVGSYLTKFEQDIKELEGRIINLNILKDIWLLPKDRNIEFDKKLLQIVPGGYGEFDLLVGLSVPSIRKLVNKWNNIIELDMLKPYITSKYHEYRQFACICLSKKMKKEYTLKNISNMNKIYNFLMENIQYINNWDLTDEVAPNVIGNYFIENIKDIDNSLEFYLNNDNLWIRRLGIVSMLRFVKLNQIAIPLKVSKTFLYDKESLVNKAVGWILREIYKKDPQTIIDFLKEQNSIKKIPSITLNYACEKMHKETKNYIKIDKKRLEIQ